MITDYPSDSGLSIPPVQNRPRRIPHVMKAAVSQKLRCLERSRMFGKGQSEKVRKKLIGIMAKHCVATDKKRK